MKYYLDSADYKMIGKYVEDYNLEGVTCNPTIIIKDQAEIGKLIESVPKGKEVFLQVISDDEEGIIRETKALMELREDVIVKIPATEQGLKAIRKLKEEKIDVLATAIYSMQQALMAANCGAAYVAPYVNRICNLEMDGVDVTLKIHKDMDQVNQLMAGGIEAVTVGADLMEKIVHNKHAQEASDDFIDAWEEYTGERKLIL